MEFDATPLPPAEWVNSEQLMAHIGIKSKVTLTKYLREGLPAHKIGRGYRFDLTEVDRWIRTSRCTDSAPGQTA